MPNRTLVYSGALFVVLLIIALARAPSAWREPPPTNFDIIVPEPEVNVPQGGSPHDLPAPEDAVLLSDVEQHKILEEILMQEHVTVSSNMTSNGKWFKMDFRGVPAYNPSILAHPHPMKKDQYVMVAQAKPTLSFPDNIPNHIMHELICDAYFDKKTNTMACNDPPEVLAIASSVSNRCDKKLDAFNYQAGPHDARAFMGPGRPYILYGSPSEYTCMGMWMQDLSRLRYWDYQEKLDKNAPFFLPTDLARPPPYGKLEKNWFVFFDRNDEMYLHYDVFPQRSFAKVNATGGVGPDLASSARSSDEVCMNQLMPKITYPAHERIHQATNSLMVTLCKYEDPACLETEHNTFILTIFHLKTSFLHDVYEPHVMLIKRTPPFEIHAIGTKSIWINGREKPTGSATAGFTKSKDQLFYVTAINFKERGRDYHGYLDDDIFLTFGIEDERSGAIDVRVADLVADLNYCSG